MITALLLKYGKSLSRYGFDKLIARFAMKRAILGALFSAAFSGISATVYFTADAYSSTDQRISLGIVTSLMMIAGFAVPIAGTCGFIFGLMGVWLVPRLPFIRSRSEHIAAASLIGGILGCVPPAISRLSLRSNPPGDSIALGFVPCVAIGILCAISWAALFLPRNPATSVH
jgi:hypothetical protein